MGEFLVTIFLYILSSIRIFNNVCEALAYFLAISWQFVSHILTSAFTDLIFPIRKGLNPIRYGTNSFGLSTFIEDNLKRARL